MAKHYLCGCKIPVVDPSMVRALTDKEMQGMKCPGCLHLALTRKDKAVKAAVSHIGKAKTKRGSNVRAFGTLVIVGALLFMCWVLR